MARLSNLKVLVKKFAVSAPPRANKWIVLPLLMVVGAAGALWALLSIINQAFVTFYNDTLLSHSHFYYGAIGAVVFGMLSGGTEVIRVVGKQLIIRDAFKVEMAIHELNKGSMDTEIRRITGEILGVIKGRPPNYSAGEYEFLQQIENINPNSDELIDPVARTKLILFEYFDRLVKSRQEERDRNGLIVAFQRLGLICKFEEPRNLKLEVINEMDVAEARKEIH